MKKYKPNIIFFISIFMSILIHLILIEKIDLGSFIKNSNDINKEVEIEINIQENQLNQKSPKKIYTKEIKNKKPKNIKSEKLIVKANPLNLNNSTNLKNKRNKIDTDNIISNISTFSSPPTKKNKTGLNRIKKISSKSKDYMYKLYFESWKRKVERMGSMNYPESAKNLGLFGSLVMTVSLDSEGIIQKMTINKSSGKKDLDQAALDIVLMGEPYAKFSARMKDEIDFVTITRTWKFSKNHNFSSKN